MKTALSYLRGLKGRMACGLTLKTVGSLAELFLPLIMAYMIDTVAPRPDSEGALLLWGVVMLAFAVVALAGNIVANRMASKVARDVTERVRNDLFEKTLSLSARKTDEVTVPSLVSRLSSDTYNVHNMIGMIQRLGVRAPILLIGGVVMTFTVEPVLALVLLAVVPVLAAVVLIVSKKGIVLYTSLQKAVDGMVRKVRDDYSGARVIKALSKTEYESRSFEGINETVVARETKAGITMGITNPVMNMFLNLGMTAVILVGAYRVAAGKAMVGEIIAFTSYFTIILNAVISVSRIFVNVSKGSASARRIGEILKTPGLPPKNALPFDASAPYLSFENVTFSYGGAPVLKNISFGIGKGQTLGVIGATGSGKTTLVNLLLRFYEADEGAVKELREKFGVVFQNDFLMAASVRENIDFERGLTDEAIERAAKIAKADGFIAASEEGYDTKLTAQGANFSGGQKQRLLIARALAADPEILVLDDSSSALDYKTDAALRKALSENYPDTTIVMIAQRISSVRFADRILVLENGEAVGFGTDAELMQRSPVYRKIYRSQAGEEVCDAE